MTSIFCKLYYVYKKVTKYATRMCEVYDYIDCWVKKSVSLIIEECSTSSLTMNEGKGRDIALFWHCNLYKEKDNIYIYIYIYYKVPKSCQPNYARNDYFH